MDVNNTSTEKVTFTDLAEAARRADEEDARRGALLASLASEVAALKKRVAALENGEAGAVRVMLKVMAEMATDMLVGIGTANEFLADAVATDLDTATSPTPSTEPASAP